jgi:hypothetical protein
VCDFVCVYPIQDTALLHNIMSALLQYSSVCNATLKSWSGAWEWGNIYCYMCFCSFICCAADVLPCFAYRVKIGLMDIILC